MNEANHVIISAILKAGYTKLNHQKIVEFINNMFNYKEMNVDAQEAFDDMYNECIDVEFIERKLQDIKNEENDY
jgi:hypothetical protein